MAVPQTRDQIVSAIADVQARLSQTITALLDGRDATANTLAGSALDALDSVTDDIIALVYPLRPSSAGEVPKAQGAVA